MRKAHRDFLCWWVGVGSVEGRSIIDVRSTIEDRPGMEDRPAEAWSVEGSSLVMRSFVPAAATAQVLKNLRVENRRADLVYAHCPFAQVYLAAAVAAKREVFVPWLNQCAAGGAVRQFCGFFARSHMNRRTLRARSSLMVPRPHYHAQHTVIVHICDWSHQFFGPKKSSVCELNCKL